MSCGGYHYQFSLIITRLWRRSWQLLSIIETKTITGANTMRSFLITLLMPSIFVTTAIAATGTSNSESERGHVPRLVEIRESSGGCV